MVNDSSSSYKIDDGIMIKKIYISKSRRASKSHHWFKSYGHLSEGVDFASIGRVVYFRYSYSSIDRHYFGH